MEHENAIAFIYDYKPLQAFSLFGKGSISGKDCGHKKNIQEERGKQRKRKGKIKWK